MSLLKTVTDTIGVTSPLVTDELTATGLKQIFDEVNQDPEAGLGCLSKEAIVIDKIMRRWNVCIQKYRGLPERKLKPLILETPINTASATASKAASISKAAGI